MHPSSTENSADHLDFDDLWTRIARLVPYAGMEDKLFWRRLEGRKAELERIELDRRDRSERRSELVVTLREFETRLRATLAVRLALLGDPGRPPSKVA
jgi:hypothetical protein